MTGRNPLRGSRPGAGPAGEPGRGLSEPQKRVSFWCAHHHRTSPWFAFTAEVPLTWDCPHCGLTAGGDQANPPPARRVRPVKSHLAHVRDRRDAEAGEAILQEALAKLRTPRPG
ncbi:MAG: RNA polymerase-binding protein RbpA [Catenulispora sp.]